MQQLKNKYLNLKQAAKKLERVYGRSKAGRETGWKISVERVRQLIISAGLWKARWRQKQRVARVLGNQSR